MSPKSVDFSLEISEKALEVYIVFAIPVHELFYFPLFLWTFFYFQAYIVFVMKGQVMKLKHYEDIKPSNRTNFRMVYYYAGRTLTQLETILKKTYGIPLPDRPVKRLERIRHKLEQMVAKHKHLEDELRKTYKKLKNVSTDE